MSLTILKRAALSVAVAGALAFGSVLPASATLIGDTITISSEANFPLDTWTDNVVVGAAVELVGGGANNHSLASPNFPHLFAGDFYDIGANTVTINYAAIGAFGFNYAFQSVFSDLDWTDMPGKLTDVQLAAGASGLLAFNISNITDDGFTFQGTVDLVNGANFTLDLTAVHDQIVVPLPAALWMFLSALGGLGIFGWRRRRCTAAA